MAQEAHPRKFWHLPEFVDFIDSSFHFSGLVKLRGHYWRYRLHSRHWKREQQSKLGKIVVLWREQICRMTPFTKKVCISIQFYNNQGNYSTVHYLTFCEKNMTKTQGIQKVFSSTFISIKFKDCWKQLKDFLQENFQLFNVRRFQGNNFFPMSLFTPIYFHRRHSVKDYWSGS